MNAIICDRNFSLLTQGKIDLESYVVTDSLATISRWNLPGRLYHSSELDSTRICASIEATFKQKLPSLSEKERSCATDNLKKILAKFSKTKDPIKEKTCQEVLGRVIGSLKPQQQEELPLSAPIQIDKPSLVASVSLPEVLQPAPSRLMPPLIEERYQQRYRYQLDQRPNCVDYFGSSNVAAVLESHPSLADPISLKEAGQFLFLCDYRKDKIARFNEGFLKQIDLYFDEPAKVLEVIFDIPLSKAANLTKQLKEGKAEFTHEQMYNIYQVISNPSQVPKNFDEAHEDFLPFLKSDAKYQREKAMQMKLLSLRNDKAFEKEERKEPARTEHVSMKLNPEPIPVDVPEKKSSFPCFQDFFNRLLAS
ncbi:MAG: hypothetical protein JSR39_07470 [Verrucomicrobia bacterium]|nr:hypothetical protein [Verrucomicrobiota bacterium]